jgi:hypothetical protein
MVTTLSLRNGQSCWVSSPRPALLPMTWNAELRTHDSKPSAPPYRVRQYVARQSPGIGVS